MQAAPRPLDPHALAAPARDAHQDPHQADEVPDLPEEGDLSLSGIPTAEAGPERRTLDAEIRRRTEAALADLSASERAAFILRHYEGRSIAEISSTLGKRDNATKQSIFRAVRKLRVALAPLASAHSQESLHEEPA